MKKSFLVICVYTTVLIALAVGWILNIINIARSDFELNGVLILQIVGIFVAPLGSVMGWVV